MAKAQSPFLIVNPKSYLYGKESLELAKGCQRYRTSDIFHMSICGYPYDQRKYN